MVQDFIHPELEQDPAGVPVRNVHPTQGTQGMVSNNDLLKLLNTYLHVYMFHRPMLIEKAAVRLTSSDFMFKKWDAEVLCFLDLTNLTGPFVRNGTVGECLVF